MRMKQLCQKILGSTIHKSRAKVITEVLETVVEAKTLSVTKLGRKLRRPVQQRSNIRKVDRLYSNKHLSLERKQIYSVFNDLLLMNPRPFLSIDGSKLLNSKFFTLRATLQTSGRGLTIYEEIYERSEYGSKKLYRRFLKGLAEVIPDNCQPVLVTDAEFRAPWFNLVRTFKWNYIGRIRGNKNIALDDNYSGFVAARSLFQLKEVGKAKSLGYGQLNKENSVEGFFYQYKELPKGRHAYTRSGRHSETEKSKKHARGVAEGWLLISSLDSNPKTIINGIQTKNDY